METLVDTLEIYDKEYAKEYRTKRPQVVTTVMDETGDAIMRYTRVTTKETMLGDGYEEHNRRTLRTYIEVIPPRKFYSEAQVVAYARYINRIAGRTLESAEMNLLLKTLARGRQYELVCVVDETEGLESVSKWAR